LPPLSPRRPWPQSRNACRLRSQHGCVGFGRGHRRCSRPDRHHHRRAPVGATSISVAPQTNVALVTFEASNALSVIDAANNYAVTTTMPVGGVGIQLGCPFDFPAPSLTAYDSARQMFYMSLGSSLYIGDDTAGFFLDDFWGFNAGCPNVPPSGYPAGPFNEIALDPGAGLMSSNGGPILNNLFNPRFEAAYTPCPPASIRPASPSIRSKTGLISAMPGTTRSVSIT